MPENESSTNKIDEIYQDYLKKLALLEVERNKITSEFIKSLEAKRIEEIRTTLQQS